MFDNTPANGDNRNERWFTQFLYGNGEDCPYVPIYDYAENRLGDIRAMEKAIEYVAANLHKCRAKCPMQFRAWCYRQIDRQAAKLAPRARKRPPAKDFTFEQHGDTCFIPVTDSQGNSHTWIIPATWLEHARALWPVHVRRYKCGGPYLARKKSVYLPGGTRKQKIVPLHHLYVEMEHDGIGDRDITRTIALNGNYLDWRDGNLVAPALDGRSVSDSERERQIEDAVFESSHKWPKREIAVPISIDPDLIRAWETILHDYNAPKRDILDCNQRVGDGDTVERLHFGWPAKRSRPPGAGPNTIISPPQLNTFTKM